MDAILKAISDIWNESGYMKLFTLGSEGSILERIGDLRGRQSYYDCNRLRFNLSCNQEGIRALLLLPIAFGMLLVNLPLGGVMNQQINSLVPLTGEELVQLRQGDTCAVLSDFRN